jgi:hypothetical protein
VAQNTCSGSRMELDSSQSRQLLRVISRHEVCPEYNGIVLCDRNDTYCQQPSAGVTYLYVVQVLSVNLTTGSWQAEVRATFGSARFKQVYLKPVVVLHEKSRPVSLFSSDLARYVPTSSASFLSSRVTVIAETCSFANSLSFGLGSRPLKHRI